MKLYLCEKPSQARDIARVLGIGGKGDGCLTGNDVVVSWCFGHLLEMSPPDTYGPAFKQWRFETLPIIPEQWRLAVKTSASKQFKVIAQLLKQARHVVIATDADREGETIARELLDHCRWRGSVTRLWLSALDDASIRKALSNVLPGRDTEALYRAGLGRARADWLVGMNLTRAYTLIGRRQGHDGVLSVGRVQTPTLNLVVERDLLIESFVATPYFDVVATVHSQQGDFRAKWIPAQAVADGEGRCISASTARNVAQLIQGKTGRITKAETTRETQAAPLPFDLSSLQQAASKRWGMGAQEVLDTAQALYETHKALTYPRTDCPYLPESQFAEASQVLAALRRSQPDYAALIDKAIPALRSKAWNDAKVTAHHAIIPTAAVADVSPMNERERRLYDMVCCRYLAQFYPAYEHDKTVIELMVENERLRANGHVPRIEGWRAVLGNDDQDENDTSSALPVVKLDDPARIIDTAFESKQTKPPARFTEGTLIAAMKSVGKQIEDPELRKVLRETSGIGTEATRAGIIETLLQRGFIQRQKKHLISTTTGRNLIALLPGEIKDPVTTAIWEQALDDIAQNRGDLSEFIARQADWVGRILRQSTDQGATTTAPVFNANSPPCPDCGQPMRRRKGKNGWFWGCSAYPQCKTTLPDQKGNPRKAKAPQAHHEGKVGDTCPQCREGTLVTRTLKSGKNSGKAFVGCTGYPKCVYFAWDAPQ